MAVTHESVSERVRRLLDQQISWPSLWRLAFTLDMEGWINEYVLTTAVRKEIAVSRMRTASYLPSLLQYDLQVWGVFAYPLLSGSANVLAKRVTLAILRVFRSGLLARGQRIADLGVYRPVGRFIWRSSSRVIDAFIIVSLLKALPGLRRTLIDAITRELVGA